MPPTDKLDEAKGHLRAAAMPISGFRNPNIVVVRLDEALAILNSLAPFAGQVQSVTLYDRALSPAEIESLAPSAARAQEADNGQRGNSSSAPTCRRALGPDDSRSSVPPPSASTFNAATQESGESRSTLERAQSGQDAGIDAAAKGKRGDSSVSRPDTAVAAPRSSELARLREFQRKIEEAEARCCPEDVGFEEWIGVLKRQVGERDVQIGTLTAAINAMNQAPNSATSPSNGTVYLLDGKPHRLCGCDPMVPTCRRGGARTLQTCGFSQCLVPAPDALLVSTEGAAK